MQAQGHLSGCPCALPVALDWLQHDSRDKVHAEMHCESHTCKCETASTSSTTSTTTHAVTTKQSHNPCQKHHHGVEHQTTTFTTTPTTCIALLVAEQMRHHKNKCEGQRPKPTLSGHKQATNNAPSKKNAPSNKVCFWLHANARSTIIVQSNPKCSMQ